MTKRQALLVLVLCIVTFYLGRASVPAAYIELPGNSVLENATVYNTEIRKAGEDNRIKSVKLIKETKIPFIWHWYFEETY
jgi:hypothetical protein